METVWNTILEFFKGDGIVVARTISILIFGLILVKLFMRTIKNTFVKSHMERTIGSFLNSVISVGLYFALFLLVGKSAGLSTGSFIAVLSAAGLAITLALKDSLSNLANGFIILGSKPFVVGDYVEVSGVSGTIKSIGIFNTKLSTPDNKIITLPNSSIIGSSVVNYSTTPTRRLDTNVSVAYDTDIDKARKIMLDIINKVPQTLNSPEPYVVITEYLDSGVTLSARAWVPNYSFWDVKFLLNESILKGLQSNNIEIPFNRLDVNVLNSAGGNDNEKN